MHIAALIASDVTGMGTIPIHAVCRVPWNQQVGNTKSSICTPNMSVETNPHRYRVEEHRDRG